MENEAEINLSHSSVDAQPRSEQERRMTNAELFDKQEELMHDKSFLVDAAFEADKAYRDSEIDRLTKAGQPVGDWLKAPLFSDAERAVLISGAAEGIEEQKQTYDKAQQKLAMGLGGFYALSEGLGMVTENNPTNSNQAHDTLNAIVSGSESDKDRNIMSRLAHATWAAGQPFRGRETRPVMKPWDKLPQEEQHKDMIQVRAAAKVLATRLTSTPAPKLQ